MNMNIDTDTTPVELRSPFRGNHVKLSSLTHAEYGRAIRSRPTTILLLLAVISAVAMMIGRAALLSDGSVPLTGGLIALSSDVLGFAVLFTTALAVARDHQTGAIDLIRVLTPAKARHIIAHALGGAILALASVIVVAIVGILTLIILAPSAVADFAVIDSLCRLAITSVLLAFGGAGIGAFCRSTAAATVVVISLYLLLPIAFLVAGFAGMGWAVPISDATLGFVAAQAVSESETGWSGVVGVAIWSAALLLLGIVREVKAK